MNRQRKARPTLEAMESKQLLSTISLDGSARGLERTQSRSYPPPLTLATLETTISGVGEVGPLGKVRISGNPGAMKLANSKGSVTLLIIASTWPISGVYHDPYTIAGGTGAYRGDQGHGELRIIMEDIHGPSSPVLERASIQFTSTTG